MTKKDLNIAWKNAKQALVDAEALPTNSAGACFRRFAVIREAAEHLAIVAKIFPHDLVRIIEPTPGLPVPATLNCWPPDEWFNALLDVTVPENTPPFQSSISLQPRKTT